MSSLGPVAVTGASGFIGSHVCKNLVEHGYSVRACVRDKSRNDRTEHLLRMNEASNDGSGSLVVFSADMMEDGSYDEIFAGCTAVFHVAGNFGTDRRWTDATSTAGRRPPIDEALCDSISSIPSETSYDQGVYDSYIVSMRHVLGSILRSQTVKRLIFTSSGCAGDCISEKENEDDYTVEDNAYGKGKVDCERLIYAFGEKHGIVCCSSCPAIVLGPILSPIHDGQYQHRLGEIFAGKYGLDYAWSVADVRDIADTQRRMAESADVRNGSRYWNGSPDAEEITEKKLISLLRELFPSDTAHLPDIAARGDDESESSYSKDSDWAGENNWSTLRKTIWRDPENDLGLKHHDPSDTISDTIVSLKKFHIINRNVSTAELRDYYNVAEMDDCTMEMEYILSELKKRS